MARISDTATFNTKAHEETVETMRSMREDVHDRGEKIFAKTGKLDPLVSISEGQIRKSKFAFVKNTDGTFTLVNGPKRPYLFATDGTGSFGAYIAKAFHAAPEIYAMLERAAKENHQMDFSFGLFQDVGDAHPPIQIPEFESDNRFAEHMRLLTPDKAGGDAPEDYDLGIYYAANHIEADLFRYGGKGVFVLLLDAPGRAVVNKDEVKRYLGHELQSSIDTSKVWQQLLTKFHSFVVVFEGGGSSTTNWWKKVTGPGCVINAPSHKLFAEVQAGLVYVVDDPLPTKEGLHEFLNADGANKKISKEETLAIWNAYVDAKVPFGANAELGIELPKAGDIFQYMSDLWPIGHPKAGENPPPGLDSGVEESTAPEGKMEINWENF